MHLGSSFTVFFFFFNDTATTEIYTLSLHDALPILTSNRPYRTALPVEAAREEIARGRGTHFDPQVADAFASIPLDRKSTRLNSSHSQISYAVFCLKKKKKIYKTRDCIRKRTLHNHH